MIAVGRWKAQSSTTLDIGVIPVNYIEFVEFGPKAKAENEAAMASRTRYSAAAVGIFDEIERTRWSGAAARNGVLRQYTRGLLEVVAFCHRPLC